METTIGRQIICSPNLSQEFVVNDAMNKHTKEKHDFFL